MDPEFGLPMPDDDDIVMPLSVWQRMGTIPKDMYLVKYNWDRDVVTNEPNMTKETQKFVKQFNVSLWKLDMSLVEYILTEQNVTTIEAKYLIKEHNLRENLWKDYPTLYQTLRQSVLALLPEKDIDRLKLFLSFFRPPELEVYFYESLSSILKVDSGTNLLKFLKGDQKTILSWTNSVIAKPSFDEEFIALTPFFKKLSNSDDLISKLLSYLRMSPTLSSTRKINFFHYLFDDKKPELYIDHISSHAPPYEEEQYWKQFLNEWVPKGKKYEKKSLELIRRRLHHLQSSGTLSPNSVLSLLKSNEETQKVEKLPYYHGLLPREDMKTMLKGNGDFLLRMSEPQKKGERAIILSMMVHEDKGETGMKHFVVRQTKDKVSIEKWGFNSIPEMINHHLKNADAISEKYPDTIIKNPIGRQSWELLHEDIEATKKLGEGAYGEVHAGKLRLKSGVKVNVAIKMTKMKALTKEQIKEVMREARLMRGFDHPNIAMFYGVAAGTEPLMVLMELVDCGALDSYISKNPNLEPIKRMEMCCQAAWGIEYLHFKSVIHCDIAARNCLYRDGKVKISDFGLTREGQTYKMDPHCRVPIRWLAPEVLRTASYSQKTDVWAYGIMCWEIFAGQEPYPGMTVAEVNGQVKQGYRMAFPEGTPMDMSTLVVRLCWTEDPNERASMGDVSHYLEMHTDFPRPPLVSTTAPSTEQQTAVQSRSKKGKSKKKGKN